MGRRQGETEAASAETRVAPSQGPPAGGGKSEREEGGRNEPACANTHAARSAGDCRGGRASAGAASKVEADAAAA
eukprot:1043391-Alexandrium_andersonii.AAC.1